MATKDITDKQVCVAYEKWSKERSVYPYVLLQAETGEPEKVCWRACERAQKNGLIDYGVSLKSGWLTDKGKELLK